MRCAGSLNRRPGGSWRKADRPIGTGKGEGNMKKEVTIIIPNYNGLAYMEACMEALGNQSFQDFHLLVVDNGSTDGSVEWLRKKRIDRKSVV